MKIKAQKTAVTMEFQLPEELAGVIIEEPKKGYGYNPSIADYVCYLMGDHIKQSNICIDDETRGYHYNELVYRFYNFHDQKELDIAITSTIKKIEELTKKVDKLPKI